MALVPPPNFNKAPAPGSQNYNPNPPPASQNFNPAPAPAFQNYNPAPAPAAYNPAPAPTPQNYNPARPSGQSCNAAPPPASQNYNHAPVPAPQDYNPALVPDAQSYYKPTTPARRGGDSYNHPPVRDGRRQFSASDDRALASQIMASDRSHDLPYDIPSSLLKYILQTVEVILSQVTRPEIHGAILVPGAHVDAQNLVHKKALHARLKSLHERNDVPFRVFNAISGQIWYKWMSGDDANKTTMDILRIVQHYDWAAKVVFALGSFAMKDGEYWLVAQLYTTNTLAKAVGNFMQVQEVLEHAATTLKPKFDAYNKLVRAIVDVTKCIVQFQYRHRDLHLTTELQSIPTTAHIPTAVYWTIQSIVVAASQLMGITGMGPEHVTEELSSLAHKLENIHGNLEENLRRLQDIIPWKEHDDRLLGIARIMPYTNTEHLKSFIPALYDLRELYDLRALYDCFNKKRVDIDVLKGKVQILFLSDLDVINEKEYLIMQLIYMDKRHNSMRPESQYEVVWVPIVDVWTEDKYRQFENLRSNMEWYSVFHPSVVSPTAIRYIRDKDKLNFSIKPLLVVMDPQGKIVHNNAVHMMFVWGSMAYPFTNRREKLLWEEETWRIELLAYGIDQNLTWITEGKYICLYGGEDIDWIRNFTRAAKNVALEARIQLELLYVGKSKPKEKVVESIMNIIQLEKLSHTLEWDSIWIFWVRLESMWQSKGQVLESEALRKNDMVMQGIIWMLSFGSSDRGWAVIGTCSAEMAMADGEHMCRSLREFNLWNRRVGEIGFVPALKEYLAFEEAPLYEIDICD